MARAAWKKPIFMGTQGFVDGRSVTSCTLRHNVPGRYFLYYGMLCETRAGMKEIEAQELMSMTGARQPVPIRKTTAQ
jgi:hypothetical protein